MSDTLYYDRYEVIIRRVNGKIYDRSLVCFRPGDVWIIDVPVDSEGYAITTDNYSSMTRPPNVKQIPCPLIDQFEEIRLYEIPAECDSFVETREEWIHRQLLERIKQVQLDQNVLLDKQTSNYYSWTTSSL